MQDPTNPYPSQIQGYSWAGQPPEATNPFVAAGTSMIQDYAMMRQNQEIQQYQQLITQPAQMSPWQQSRVAYQPQYQFGMMGGQQGMYNEVQRSSSLTGTSFALSAGMVGATWPMFTWGDTMGKALLSKMAPSFATTTMGRGAGFVVGGMAGMAITAPFTMLASKGVERAQFASDIERDISDYSGRWTSGLGFGRGSTRELSIDMMKEMNAPGQFFRGEDQLKIHKMGLASGMVKGRDVSEYKKSFDELKSNAQDIIKMLNTTVEGGMSVMQELQRAGVTSTTGMRQQVFQAKSLGNISGIGSQNMLALGAAGAQAAMGTGWNAAVASTMYQTNAAMVTQLAQNNPYMANAVTNVGGTAAAAAAVSNATMNVFKSGMGIQVMAAIMDPKTRGINDEQFRRFTRGEMGVFEIAGRAGNYGMSGGRGGGNNRVLFEKYASRNWNSMSMAEQSLMLKGTFRQWASTRGGVDEASAYVFAKQFTNNSQEAEIFGELLMNPANFDRMKAGQIGQEYMLRASGRERGGAINKAFRGIGTTAVSAVQDMADDLYRGTEMLVSGGAKILNRGINRLGGGYLFDTYRGPAQTAELANRMYGFNSISMNRIREAAAVRGVLPNMQLPKLNTEGIRAVDNLMRSFNSSKFTASQKQQAIEMLNEANLTGSNIADSPLIQKMAGGSQGVLRNSVQLAATTRTLNANLNSRNELIQKSAASLQDWQKDPGKYSRELDSYYSGASKVNSFVAGGMRPEDAISKVFGSGSGSAEVARRSLNVTYGVQQNLKVPTPGDMPITKSEYDRAKGAVGYISEKVSMVTQAKAAFVLSGGGVPGEMEMASIGVARATNQVNKTKALFPGIKDVNERENLIRTLSMQKNDTAKQRYLTDYQAARPGVNVLGEMTYQEAISGAWGQEKNVQTMQAYRVAETRAMISQNIAFIKKGGGVTEDVAKMMEKVIYGNSKDFTKKDLDLVRKSGWGREQGMGNETTFSQIQSALIGATATTAATAENIVKAQNDELRKQLVEVDKAMKGSPTADGKYSVYGTNYTKDQLEKKKQEIINNIKNDAGQQYANNSAQGQQTSAPNILNYWNTQWMVR
jgi:hypothetical protein